MLTGLQIWHVWIIAGILLFIMEIFVPAFLMGSLGLGAWAAAVAAGFGLSFTIQLSVFAVTMLVVFFLLRPFFNKTLARYDNPTKTGVQALIGKRALVTEPIHNITNQGRVKIGGELWKACSANGQSIPEGAHVEIQRVEGVTVFVTPIQEN